jgi:hypothetical protein
VFACQPVGVLLGFVPPPESIGTLAIRFPDPKPPPPTAARSPELH